MAEAYLTVIGFIYLGFAVIFLLLFHLGRSRLAGGFAVAWLLEAFRTALLVLEEMKGVPLAIAWYTTIELLYLPVTWFLLYGSTELTGRRLPRLWTALYFTVSSLIVLSARYLVGPHLIASGRPAEEVWFYITFIILAALLIPGGLARLWLAGSFFRYWQGTRLPGALLAGIFAVPHAVGSLAVPFEWYFSWEPSHLIWFFEILGLSLGVLMLDLNRQAWKLKEALDKVKTLRGLLPICAACKRVRDDRGYWEQLDLYLGSHTEVEFTHGLCPQCLEKYQSDLRRLEAASLSKQ